MKPKVSSTLLENFQVMVRTGTHSWLADEPAAAGGDGLGPNPFELLLGALAACLTITVAHFAGQGKVPLQGLWVDVEGDEPALGGEGEYHVSARLRVRGDLGEKDLARLRRYAERCPIHGILSKGAAVELSLEKV